MKEGCRAPKCLMASARSPPTPASKTSLGKETAWGSVQARGGGADTHSMRLQLPSVLEVSKAHSAAQCVKNPAWGGGLSWSGLRGSSQFALYRSGSGGSQSQDGSRSAQGDAAWGPQVIWWEQDFSMGYLILSRLQKWLPFGCRPLLPREGPQAWSGDREASSQGLDSE